MGDVGYMSSWPPYSQDGVGLNADMQQRIDGEASARMAEFMAELSGHLSNYVRTLQTQCQSLQQRVSQLEEWKRNTSQEMRKLRAQQESAKRLLAQLNGEPDDEVMRRAVSLPMNFALEQHGASGPSQGWMTPTSSRPTPTMEHSKSMPFVAGGRETGLYSPGEGIEALADLAQVAYRRTGTVPNAPSGAQPCPQLAQAAAAPVGQQKALKAVPGSNPYKIGDAVEVWSSSAQDWLAGEVKCVQGLAVEVFFTGPDGAPVSKNADASSAELRFRVGAPPGLGFSLPAGLPAFGQGSQSSSLGLSLPSRVPSLDDSAAPIKDGIEVKVSEDCMMTCIEWRIAHMSKRLKDCMGRPLVSSPFNAWDIQGMLLMICPDCGDGSRGRTRRQKQLYNSKVNEGSMHASVKLKVADCPHELTYHVEIGDEKRGPFKHNFAVEGGSIVSANVDLGIDFLSKLEPDGGLLVRVSIQAPEPVRELGSQAST